MSIHVSRKKVIANAKLAALYITNKLDKAEGFKRSLIPIFETSLYDLTMKVQLLELFPYICNTGKQIRVKKSNKASATQT